MKKFVPLWLVFALLVPFVLLQGHAGEPAPDMASGALDEFEVARDGDLLLVPLTIEAKTYHFVLDTGATLTVFDNSFRHLLGDPVDAVEGDTPAGSVRADLFHPPKASVGKLPFRVDTPVTAMDLSRMRSVSGLDPSGILGMDFLRCHVVRIDFDAGRVSFCRSVGADAGEALDITIDDYSIPSVEGVLPVWGTEPFNIDTGAFGPSSGSLGNLPFKSVLTSGRLRPMRDRRRGTLAGDSVCRHGRLEMLEVGKSAHKNLVMDEASYSSLAPNGFCGGGA